MNSHIFLGQLEVNFVVPNEVLGNFPVAGLFVQLPYTWAVQEPEIRVQQILVIKRQTCLFAALIR